ncbi:MAG: acetyl-CoA carboxylase biotin carboxyl carrier protein subunit [Flavobacteriales bacterium]|jgi:biotin carboxyl carrier protein|nr:acetyl-CoA carboxylase biotin carboxyl carrier protein subunit [Flavobacteriales bacterium]
MEKSFKVLVNDSFNYDFDSSDLNNLDLLPLPNSKFHALKNNKSYIINVDKSDFNNREYTIEVGSNKYIVKILNTLDATIKEIGLSVGNTKKLNTIKAPMPGLILNINIKEGQEVKEGDTLVILEAMKMENAIEAPKDGIIKSINIKIGNTVEKGALMIELE